MANGKSSALFRRAGGGSLEEKAKESGSVINLRIISEDSGM